MNARKKKKYKSDQFRNQLIRQIHTGVLKVGDSLESCRTLSDKYQLSYATVRKTLKELNDCGYLETAHGKGTIVKSAIPQNDLNCRVLLYDEVISDTVWQNFIASADKPGVYIPSFVSRYCDLLDSHNYECEPDIIQTSDGVVETMAHRELLEPLDNIAMECGIDLDNFFPELIEQMRWQGKLYAIPVCFSTFALFYNKDMFDEAGLSYPTQDWTWEDLKTAAIKLTVLESEYYIKHYGYAPYLDKSSIINFYLEGLEPGADLNQAFFESSNVAGFKFILDLVSKYHAGAPPCNSPTLIDTLFNTGRAAMTSNKYPTVKLLKNAPFRWGVTELPAGRSKSTSCSIQAFGIRRSPKNPLLAGNMLKTLTSPAIQQAIYAGFGNIPACKKQAGKAVYSKSFISQLPNIKHIYLNYAENKDYINNIILQAFLKLISPEMLLEELRNIAKKDLTNPNPKNKRGSSLW